MTEKEALKLLREFLMHLRDYATLDHKIVNRINDALKITKGVSND